MVTVSRRALLPLLAPILAPTVCPTLASNPVPTGETASFPVHHANREFGMIYPGPKTTLPMRGGRI
jgi:hypothetical protein